MSRVALTLYDGVMHRTGVVPHNPEKPPVNCQFCYKPCNPHTYYTWQIFERARFNQKPPAICHPCCEQVEHWTDRIAGLIPQSEWKNHEIIPRPCQMIKDLMEEDRMQEEAAEREAHHAQE